MRQKFHLQMKNSYLLSYKKGFNERLFIFIIILDRIAKSFYVTIFMCIFFLLLYHVVETEILGYIYLRDTYLGFSVMYYLLYTKEHYIQKWI